MNIKEQAYEKQSQKPNANRSTQASSKAPAWLLHKFGYVWDLLGYVLGTFGIGLRSWVANHASNMASLNCTFGTFFPTRCESANDADDDLDDVKCHH